MMQFAFVKNAFSAACEMGGFSCAATEFKSIIILGAIIMASIFVALISLRASLLILLALILMASEYTSPRPQPGGRD